MLSRHMKEISPAFELEFCESNKLEEIRRTIVIRIMDEFEESDHPDFPTEDLGLDLNGGLYWKRLM